MTTFFSRLQSKRVPTGLNANKAHSSAIYPRVRTQYAARLLSLVIAALCLVSATLSAPRSAYAQAQPLEFPVDNFKPAASAFGYWVTENGTVLKHLHPSFNLYGNYASRPLQLIDTTTGERQQDLIRRRVNLDLLMAIGLFDILEFGLAIPATVMQGSDNLQVLDRPAGSNISGGFRDIRFIPKIQLAHAKDDVVAVALALPVTFPSGSSQNLLGSGGFAFSPTLIFSVDTKYFDWALNAGYRMRKYKELSFSVDQPSVYLGSELFGSTGVKIAFVPKVIELVGDVWASSSAKQNDFKQVPIETLGGLRYHVEPGLLIHAGAGAGLTRGIGAPQFRVLLGVGYESVLDPDPDKDGILTEVDSCPEVAEDFDQFEDEDGCPDPDNDQDGVLDTSDRCPNEPEDRDGFEDTDGCPDPDNDKDEILDVDDKCPNDAEDKDQFEDTDGCPDPDNDKDGVLDGSDQCPTEPEDVDGFEDENGCPDPDNDKDQVLDKDDKCPTDPEDPDNFEDADGCPDPDNDKDGILDVNDRCPLEPETFNGNEDEDGCPDKAKGPVKIEHGKITTPPVFFASGKDVILKKSFPTLEMVANIFKANDWVKRVRVEGHTDDRGNDNFNMDLSERRAASVMRFLIEHGVEAERLESKGFGETQPVASNKTGKGRAKNRRVDFVILDPPQSQNPVEPQP